MLFYVEIMDFELFPKKKIMNNRENYAKNINNIKMLFKFIYFLFHPFKWLITNEKLNN